jgi:hypothetical protein
MLKNIFEITLNNIAKEEIDKIKLQFTQIWLSDEDSAKALKVIVKYMDKLTNDPTLLH